MKNRFGALLLFLVLSCTNSYGQDVVEWYKKLPAELVDLDSLQLATLLDEGKYLHEGEDTTIFILEYIDEENDYLLISWAYLNGIPAWTNYEARLYSSDIRNLLVVSIRSGVRVDFYQRDLEVFEMDANGSLQRLDVDLHVDKEDFFMANTPQEYYSGNRQFFCFVYEIYPIAFPEGFGYIARSCYTENPSIEKYQVLDHVEFRWTGKEFIRK